MAFATKRTKTEFVKTEKLVPAGVTLELTDTEARVLQFILGGVGGSPQFSLRGHSTNIRAALTKAGYSPERNLSITEGSIYFADHKLAGMQPTERDETWSF